MNLRDYLTRTNKDRPNIDAPWIGLERSSAEIGKIWRCVLIHHLTGEENAGRHNVFVDLLDSNGALITKPAASLGWTWEGRGQNEPAPPKAFDKTGNEPAANLDIYKGQHVTAWVIALEDSDRVTNLRSDPPSGEDDHGNSLFHHSYYLVFQLLDAVAPVFPSLWAIGDNIKAIYTVNVRNAPGLTGQVIDQAIPGQVLKITGAPRAASGLNWWQVAGGWVAETTPAGVRLFEKVAPQTDWDRAIDFVLKWEGGYSDNPNDPGGETNYGISKRSYPQLDIKNLTRDQAVTIYQRDYWQRSGAANLPWPLNIVHFDSAVNCGVTQANAWLGQANGSAADYLGLRLNFYTQLGTWPTFGLAWARRVSDLLSVI